MSKGAASAHERLRSLSKEQARLLNVLIGEKAKRAQLISPRSPDSDDSLPASSAQRQLWLVVELEGGGAAYHVPVAARVFGPLDRDALQKALDTLVLRHEVLRTVFVNTDGNLTQRIAAEGRFELRFVDLSGVTEQERTGRAAHHMQEEAQARFDLRTGPLIRGRLLKLAAEEHLLLMTVHHIVFDAWSMEVWVRELAALYDDYRHGRGNRLDPLPIQYADYAVWQRQWLQGDVVTKQLSYWRMRLQGAAPQLELPVDRPRPAVQSYRGEKVAVALGERVTEELKAFARNHDVTLFMALAAAWAVLLSRLSGQQDVSIGTPIANRQRPELQGLIGFFVNTLVLRLEVPLELRVRELLQQIKEVTLGAYDHQDVPFEQVVETLQPQRSLSRNPLFQAMLVVQNESDGQLRLPGLTVVPEASVNEPSKFDLLLSLEVRGDQIEGHVTYATDLFEKETVQRWMESFVVLLEAMTHEAERCVGDLPLLSESQRRYVVEALNATGLAYPRDQVIHGLFEEQARRIPDEVAVEHAGTQLTYAELNSRSDQLARYLRNQSIGPDGLVGIFVERGVEMVVGLLGILKAGGAYLPLDPNYPAERLQYMIEVAAPRVILTQEKLRTMLPVTRATVTALDAEWSKVTARAAENKVVDSEAAAHNLVYVIYTSGSTGRPKATAMAHRCMVNLIEWQRRNLPGKDGLRVLQFAALSFDVAFQETFSTLCTGGTLVMLDEWVRRDVPALVQLLNEQSIERLFVPPLMLQNIAEHLKEAREAPRSLRDVITAGEQLRISPELASLMERIDGCRLHNHYGPTETHVVTALTLTGAPQTWPVLPTIGRPIANTQIYVLDRRRQPVPVGVVGEIYIGGANVAHGYLGRPELTAERFLPDPFNADTGARVYRTGDLGRWRHDGTIEYLGRNDDQVKIRGYRIELGEIETRLARHDQVKDAVVVAREDIPGGKRLVAYITRQGESGPNVDALRTYLQGSLPAHMVPSAFVLLDALPVTPSGKVDRRSLPAPDTAAYASREYEAPRGAAEQTLAAIWQELLRVDRVSRHDNFFELGGHSLLMVQMMARLRRAGMAVEVRSIYANPTLSVLAGTLTRTHSDEFAVPQNLIPRDCEHITPQMLPLVELEAEHIDRIARAVPGGMKNIQDIYPLVPLQEGILFHHLFNEQGGDAYIVPMLLSLSSRELLERFIQALQQVVDRHDMLRTAIVWEQLPRSLQVVYREAALVVEEWVLDRSGDIQSQLKERMKPEHQRLDLRQAPLMRLQVAADPFGQHWYALLQLHHLVCDHESLETLFSEVMTCFKGGAAALAEPVPYRNHVAQALANVREHDTEAFFRSKLADIDEPTAPFGLLDVHGDGSRVEQARQPIDLSLARRLRAQARRLGVSPATLFHVAWGLVVGRTSARDDVVFGSVLLGRLQGSAGAHRILGMFMNTLPLRMRLKDVTTEELVRQTQNELAELLSYEQASLAVAQRCSGIVGRAPLFSAMLNYRHSAVDLVAELSSAEGVEFLKVESWTNYPVLLSVDDLGDGFVLDLETERLIDPNRMIGYTQTALVSLVDALEKAPQTAAVSLEIVPDAERRRIDSFNFTRTDYPRDKSIQQVFEEQVRRTPHAVAAIYDAEVLTYAEINRRANQCARYLISRGLKPGQFVPVVMPRSLQLLVAELAVLKAGGAYLPLDPEIPTERQEFMIGDCGARVLLASTARPEGLRTEQVEWIDCAAASDSIDRQSTDDLDLQVDARAPAYVMYTSGSTGIPKGVIVPHHAVNRLAINNGYAQIQPADCIAHYSNSTFDASTFEIWGAWLNGARILILPQSCVLEPATFAQVLRQHDVSIMYMSVGLFNQYTEHLSEVFSRLRYLMVGGDALEPGTVRRVLRNSPPQHLLNVYGPTECTTFSTTHSIEAVAEDATSIPIGVPMANAQVYILDKHRRVAPVGVTGELYIGGAGVANGYLNRPELTQERFIQDPFSGDPDARLYKTGDLGQWRNDGTIEFLGRNDNQVKIRGFRIELGEIESQLARHPHIKEAAVIARQDDSGDKRLVGYVTQRGPVAPSAEELREHLKATLPEYMIPGAFVLLESLPLTPTGKLNRRALPAPDLGAFASREYQAPRGEVEQLLAQTWQELLGVERIGRHDNFFELGGHSLLATRVMSRIREILNVEVPLRSLFDAPSVEELAPRIEEEMRRRAVQESVRAEQLAQDLMQEIDGMTPDAILQRIAQLEKELGSASSRA